MKLMLKALITLQLCVQWFSLGVSRLQTTPHGGGVTDDLIFSGSPSGCGQDDEDDCSAVGSGDKDSLITPVVNVLTTPKPPTTTPRATPTPSSTTTESHRLPGGSGEPPCDDEEDCEGSGSGFVEPDHPHQPTDDIYLNPGGPKGTTEQPDIEEPGEVDEIPDTPSPVDKDHPSTTKSASLSSSTTESMFISVNFTETPSRKATRPPPPHIGSSEVIPDSGLGPGGPGGGQNTGIGSAGGKTTKPTGKTGISPLGLNIGLIVGIAGGVLLLLLLLAYALYKYKSRDEGSYKIDESKNYPYDSGCTKPCMGPAANGGVSKSGMHTSKPHKKKDVKEWYV